MSYTWSILDDHQSFQTLWAYLFACTSGLADGLQLLVFGRLESLAGQAWHAA